MKITITDGLHSDKNNHTVDCTYHYPEMIVQIKHKTIYKANLKAIRIGLGMNLILLLRIQIGQNLYII